MKRLPTSPAVGWGKNHPYAYKRCVVAPRWVGQQKKR
jgi:hypothetical protein